MVIAALVISCAFSIAKRRFDRFNDATPWKVIENDRRVFHAYAGSTICRECHPEEYELWRNSNHARAERPVNTNADLVAFHPARTFKHGTQETHVRFSNGRFLLTCLGSSKINETHEVLRVIGHDPLRQFLLVAPGGRYQVAEAAYDPLSNEWFNVYGREDRQPGEWGHWTGRGMTWNSMCAACHNTRLRKNYDPRSDTYRTTMAEPAVGCEACHGPLKAHVTWQARFASTGDRDPTLPQFTKTQVVDYCGFCHARRIDLTGDFRPGDPLTDHQDPSVVDRSEVYYPDGQIRDETYEYSSFLGSKMYTSGVYCMDCHDPHSGETRLPGNWLCMRCHNGAYPNAPVIQPVDHSHHKVYGYDTNGVLTAFDLTAYNPKTIAETGGECVNCHMPQTVYMQRHWRHDHGFTCPDPLLTQEFGIPNACTRCHADKTENWAIEWTDKWYGTRMDRPARHRARAFAKARAGDPSARKALLELLNGNDSPYWKASAVRLLEQWVTEPTVRRAILCLVRHPHPLVRVNAVRALESLVEANDAAVIDTIRALLNDTSRAVRVAAAAAMYPDLPPKSQAAAELRHFLAINSDQPGGQMMLGALEFRVGRIQNAYKHYAAAVSWDPNSALIRHELAILLSRMGRVHDAVEQLEIACRLDPREAEFAFKLGLAWNDAGDLNRAVEALERAVRLDPKHARAWYNLGLALHKLGQPERALLALSRGETNAPSDPAIPYARATILAQLSRIEEARHAAKRALEIHPGFSEAADLLDQLR
ncbi:MAG: tetratricopeptide repeat protein [Verrucomicrobiae bacterium]|nr:tetratricopeptide repeat protein [Verrucomicrobiae bacterium]